jgi:hypothetical protein
MSRLSELIAQVKAKGAEVGADLKLVPTHPWKPTERELGMYRNITRRDILHGFGAMIAGALFPLASGAGQAGYGRDISSLAGGYPPALTGLRGNHPGSFEVAHQLAREGLRDWGPIQQADSESTGKNGTLTERCPLTARF